MAIAGFVGMFIQFLLSIIQTIYEERGLRICYVAKSSPFSNRILNGIMTATLNETNVSLTTKMISTNDTSDVNEAINTYIEKNTKNYDGFIIRVENDDDRTNEMLMRLERYKVKYVLVDKKVYNKNRSEFGNNPPIVLSDFAQGGKLLGEKVVSYCKEKAFEEPKIVVLSNSNNSPSKKRTNEFMDVLSGEEIEYTRIAIESLDPQSAIDTLKNKYSNGLEQVDVIYCGNDNIAVSLMKAVRIGDIKCNEKVLFVGYDGIKDGEGYKLDYYAYNYITVDTEPEEQGKKAYELIKLKELEELRAVTEILQPKIIESRDN